MKIPLMIAAAITLAVAAAWAVFAYTASTEERVISAQGPVTAVVAVKELSSGTSFAAALASGAVEQRTVTLASRPAGSIETLDDIDRRYVALADVPVGRVLLLSDFAPQLPDVGPLQVPDGLVAVSVALSDPARVGSFLRPGSVIAIFSTNESSGGSERRTRLLLPRADVVAVGSAVSADSSGADDSTLVTVAVTQREAERLVHGIQTGTLYFGLLNSKTILKPSTGVADSSLFD
jgi:pilus assembly protein CpaB